MCIVNSMYTEAINHGPGVTFMQTGSQFPGRPSMGAWLSYGLGSMNDNLPSFVVLKTKGKGGQPLVSRLWGSGFLPGKHAGTRFRADKDAILYLNSPEGVSREGRRKMLDRLKELHELQLDKTGDPVLETRIAQYEMGYRMQSSIPEVTALIKNLNLHLNYMVKRQESPVLLQPIAYLPVGWLKKESVLYSFIIRDGTNTVDCLVE